MLVIEGRSKFLRGAIRQNTTPPVAYISKRTYNDTCHSRFTKYALPIWPVSTPESYSEEVSEALPSLLVGGLINECSSHFSSFVAP